MNEIMMAPNPGDPAEAAFARMQGEVALLRCAIEAMAAERAGLETPDYGPTLGQIAADLAATVDAITALEGSPALQLTPQALAGQIVTAAAGARQADHAALAAASATLTRATGDLNGWMESARQTTLQNWRLIQVGLAGLVGGAILGAAGPGAAARIAPRSWGWPEALAARALGLSRWDAGERMLAIADPGQWRAVVQAKRLTDDNAPAIAACATTARKTGKPVRCQVTIGPQAAPPPR